MENKNIEVVETEVVETEATEVQKEKFLTKAGKFAKKHGKKALVGAGLIVASGVAYALGKKSGEHDEADCDYEAADNIIDVDFGTTEDEN